MIVERKSMRTPGGSPTRRRPDSFDEDSSEQVVGRFELDVQFADEEYVEEEEGELRVITY
jgi:hypothetical protein